MVRTEQTRKYYRDYYLLNKEVLKKQKYDKCLCGNKKAKQSKICQKCCRGDKSPNWSGGKFNKNGYIYILVGKDSWHTVDSDGYCLEHRFVMENFLQRKLNEFETVHHKNGIKSDNNLPNLELWSSNHPGGQRVFDKIVWAKKILEDYGSNENDYL